jgi:hypothetical protein
VDLRPDTVGLILGRRRTAAGTRLAAVAVALAATAGCGAPAPTGSGLVDEIKYSYGDSSDSVVFDWHGDATKIQFGLTARYGRTVHAKPSQIRPQNGSGRYQEATLRGLKPGQAYHYRIGSSGPDRVFHTIPTGSFTWVDVGDTMSTSCHGEGTWMPPEHRLIAAQHPAFVAHGGDIAVPNQCGRASLHQYFVDQQVWSTGVAFQPVWGDHEWEGKLPNSPPDALPDSNSNYKGRVFMTHAQSSPADDRDKTTHPGCGAQSGRRVNTCQGEDWGWFQAGGVLFISYPETSWKSWTAWQAKADALMAQADADPSIDFVVTYGHRAPFTDSTIGPNREAAVATQALAAKYSPDSNHPRGKYVLSIGHHAHSMEVFKPINGLTYVVDAAGGQGLTSWVTPVDPRSVFRSMHFGLLSGHYDRASHTLTYAMVCGPNFRWEKDICRYGTTLYRASFSRPTG